MQTVSADGKPSDNYRRLNNLQAGATSEQITLIPSARHSLLYGPFLLDSEVDVPELRNFTGTGHIPVSLRLGAVPELLAGSVPYGTQRHFTTSEFLLNVPGTGRFYVRDGREIRVEPAPGAPGSDLAIYLLGSVFGALCHQNGLLPLHASAVEVRGEVTAFLGHSGAGKSSLAALLRERGYRIFADDICLLEPVKDGLAAAPLAGWLKLWRETFTQIGVDPKTENRTFSTDDKYRMYLEPQEAGMLPVRQFCFLTRARESDTLTRLQPLGTAEAIVRLLAMIYPGYMPEAVAEEQRLFRQCAQALAGARAVELVMPWGWDKVGGTVALLERELLRG